MKRLLIALMLLMPLATMAQDNTWERPVEPQQTGTDPKYLEGAVPEVNGKVVFETTVKAPGKSADEVYNIMLAELERMTTEPGQLENCRVTIADPDTKQLVGTYQEWLVFKNQALNLDRTRLLYHLIVDCADGEATIKMTRIVYIYEEERDPQTYHAEQWITDRYGLNKKRTKLARASGKFRRKTIDRKDYLFNRFETLLAQ